MNQSSDFVDLIRTFNDHRVEYLIVGAHALAAHGHVRATKDLDVWIRPSAENAQRVYRALAEFGAPLDQVTPGDFAVGGTVFQIGVAPLRIDVVNQIDGVDFDGGWSDRVSSELGGEPVSVLSRRAMIENKKAAGRPQDLADLQWLTENDDS